MVSYEANVRTLKDWINHVEKGRAMLPRFQRMEVWDRNKVKELFQSIVEGVPVGSLLLLQVGDKPQFANRPIKGAPGPSEGERIQELILDGQQRLTSIWRGLNDDYREEGGELGFSLYIQTREGIKGRWRETPKEELPKIRTVRLHTKKRGNGVYPKWREKDGSVFDRGLVPLSLFHPDNSKGLKNWARKFKDREDVDVWDYIDELEVIAESIKDFKIPHISLLPDAEPEDILETFIRTNTQAEQLKPFDLVVARTELSGVDLHEKVSVLFDTVPELENRYGMDPESPSDDADFLRAAVLLKNELPTISNILKLDGNHLENIWDDLIKGVDQSINFLENESVFDNKRLPTEVIMPLLFCIYGKVMPDDGFEKGNAEVLLRKYIWSSFYSERYRESTNTRVREDFKAIKDYIENGGDNEIPCLQAELPKMEDLIEADWPKRKSRLARSILVTTLRGGAKDLYSGEVISPDNISIRQYHHIFPKSYLEKKGYPDEKINQALNVALITPTANRKISAKRPRDYIQEIEDNSVEDIKERLRTHLIPIEPLIDENYEEFIEQRAKMVHEGMKDLVDGKDWRP
ncbi:MAG: DUF262 domain-containing protein [Thermoplasmata archaeon]